MSDVLVFSSYDENYAELGELISRNHAMYCDLHGYDYECTLYSNKHSYSISWEKIEKTIFYAKTAKYKRILWIDVDAFFINTNIKVENITQQEALKSFNIGRNKININSDPNGYFWCSTVKDNGPCLGIFLALPCQELINFLSTLLSYRDSYSKIPADELALKDLIVSNNIDISGLRFLNQNKINSFWPTVTSKEFILHTCATENDKRIELFDIFNPFRAIQFDRWMRKNNLVKYFWQQKHDFDKEMKNES